MPAVLCVKKHRDGQIEYYHQSLAAVIVHPDQKSVLPLEAKAVASGSAAVQAHTDQSTINPFTVESLAETVQAIATSANNRPRTSDMCLDIL